MVLTAIHNKERLLLLKDKLCKLILAKPEKNIEKDTKQAHDKFLMNNKRFRKGV